jgi:tetratricopeptide (TPR) repeat protein
VADKINCPFCGKLTDPDHANCPHCGGPLQHRPQRRPPAPETPGGSGKCPNCNAPVEDGDIICVRCGTNLLTGQKIVEEQPAQLTPRPPQRNWIPLAAIIAIAAVALAGTGALAWYLSRDVLAEAKQLATRDRLLEAVNLLTVHTDAHPGDAEAQLLFGKVLWKSQQYARAARAFRAAANLAPENENASLLALIATARSTTDTASNEEVTLLQSLLQNDPDNQKINQLLAAAMGASGDFARQNEILRAMVPEAAGDTGIRRQISIARAMTGQYEEARDTLRQAGTAENGDTAAILGFIAWMRGQPEEAAARLETALDTGTSAEGAVRTRLGLIYLSTDRQEDALMMLDRARSLPDAPEAAAFFYALCLRENGLDDEALAEFDRLTGGSGYWATEAAIQMAALYLDQDNLSRANEYVMRAMQAGEATAALHTLLGRIHLREGETVKAQEAFRLAIQKDPAWPAAHLENGLVYISRGVLPEGLRELQRYLELIGSEDESGAANEIRLLVEQLKETMDQQGGTRIFEETSMTEASS